MGSSCSIPPPCRSPGTGGGRPISPPHGPARRNRWCRRNSGNPGSAGCDESRTSGGEGGPGKRTQSNLGTASRSDPYIIGKQNRSAIGTLVERSTRYVMLLHLPTDHTAQAVRDALTKTVLTLPTHLRRSVTWDQGKLRQISRGFTAMSLRQIDVADGAATVTDTRGNTTEIAGDQDPVLCGPCALPRWQRIVDVEVQPDQRADLPDLLRHAKPVTSAGSHLCRRPKPLHPNSASASRAGLHDDGDWAVAGREPASVGADVSCRANTTAVSQKRRAARQHSCGRRFTEPSESHPDEIDISGGV